MEKEKLTNPEVWIRAYFILVFLMMLSILCYLVILLTLIQFCFALFTGQANSLLKRLGSIFANYCYDIVMFLTYQTEQKPFPFKNSSHD